MESGCRKLLILYLQLLAGAIIVSETNGANDTVTVYVCYYEKACANDSARPAYTLEDSTQACCSLPGVLSSASTGAGENCENCIFAVERVTSRYVAFVPPEPLVLEVRASSYDSISWFHNATIPVGRLEAVELGDFDQRFTISETIAEDYGTYEADVQPIDDSLDVLVVDFVVGPYVPSSISLVDQTPESSITNDLVNLSCQATGNPPPDITWLRGNDTLPVNYTSVEGDPPISTAVVQVHAPNPTGLDLYKCVVSNSHGSAEMSDESVIYLRAVPPQITQTVASRSEVTVGSAETEVEVVCTVSSRPESSVTWLRNGMELDNSSSSVAIDGRADVSISQSVESSDNMYSNTTSVLRLSSVSYQDRGEYACVARNLAGNASAVALQLVVNVPPNVTTHPTEVVVNIHETDRSVVLTCTAFGFPAPQLVWITSGGLLTTNSSNGGGSSCSGDSIADVFGGPPPYGEDEWYDIAIGSGSSTSPDLRPTTCSVSLEVLGGGDASVSVLTISGAEMEQAANFTCSGKNNVTNFIGSPEEDVSQFSTTNIPYFLKQLPEETRTVITMSQTLTCVVIGQTLPTVEWLKDGQPLSLSGTQEVDITSSSSNTTLTSSVTVMSVGQSNAGRYTCLANNSDGMDSQSTTLIVQEPASVLAIDPPSTARKDTLEVSFTCAVMGFPLPVVQWARRNTSEGSPLMFIEEDSRISFTSEEGSVGSNQLNSTLTIASLELSDEGEYFCIASNGVPTAGLGIEIVQNRSTDVNVLLEPVFIFTSNSTVVLENSSVLLMCDVFGDTLPDIVWRKGSDNLINDPSGGLTITFETELEANGPSINIRRSNLTIEKTSIFDTGDYECFSINGVGTAASAFIELNVEGPPFFIGSSPDTVIDSPLSVTLNCTVRGNPRPTIEWRKDNQPITPGDRITIEEIDWPDDPLGYTFTSFLTITDTGLSDTAEYVCRGNNDLTTDEDIDSIIRSPTINLKVLGAPNVTVAPGNGDVVRANETADVVLTCTGHGLPSPNVTWHRGAGPLQDRCMEMIISMTGEADEVTDPPTGPTTDPGFDTTPSPDSFEARCLIIYEPLEEQATATLMIQNLMLEDQDNYTCRAENEKGSANVTTPLIIEVPLFENISISGDTNATAGQSFSLTCSVNKRALVSTSQLTVEWVGPDGGVVSDGEGVTIDTEDTSYVISVTLSFDQIRTSQAGRYMCRARSPAENSTVSSDITVAIPPPEVSITPGSITVPAGGNISLTCSHVVSDAVDTYITNSTTWIKDGSLVLSTSSQVTVRGAEVSDAGSYTCLVSVESGSPLVGSGSGLSTVTVEVVEQSVVIANGSSIAGNEGDDLTIVCDVFSVVFSKATWLKDKRAIVAVGDDPSHRREITGEAINYFHYRSVLTLMGVLPISDDIGKYVCRASNPELDLLFDSIQVDVQAHDSCATKTCENGGTCEEQVDGYRCLCAPGYQGLRCHEPVEGTIEAPEIVSETEEGSVEVDLTDPLALACEATGNPLPLYTWFKDSAPVHSSVEPGLELPEVRPEDRGVYQCHASNEGGNDTADPTLVTVEGVYQYLLSFSACSSPDLHTLSSTGLISPNGSVTNITAMACNLSNCIAGTEVKLQGSPSKIYIVTERPVRSNEGPPPSNQIVVTIVTEPPHNATGLQDAVWSHFVESVIPYCDGLTCNYTDIVRFDGCPVSRTPLYADSNSNYTAYVEWPESKITDSLERRCPCGRLQSPLIDYRLRRECGGSYSYGAEWREPDTSECAVFTDTALLLCSITLLPVEEQPMQLASAKVTSDKWSSPLELAIASLILEGLVGSEHITDNTEFKAHFARSFDNVLKTNRSIVHLSEHLFQSSQRLFQTFEAFTQALEHEPSPTTPSSDQRRQSSSPSPSSMGVIDSSLFEETVFSLLVEDVNTLLYVPGTFLAQFQVTGATLEEAPVIKASISLPTNLVQQLVSTGVLEPNSPSLRVATFAFQSPILYALDSSSVLARSLAVGNQTQGNYFIGALVSAAQGPPLLVRDLAGEPVSISYTLAEELWVNGTNSSIPECVYWKLPNESEQFGSWASDGCVTIVKDTAVDCECDRLAHFGLLMTIHPREQASFSLQAIVYICLILAIFFLLIILFTYSCSKKLRHMTHSRMLVQLCLSLVLLWVVFLVAMHKAHGNFSDALCGIFSALLQYFMLVFFAWTACQAFFLCLKIVKVFYREPRFFYLELFAVAWGIPAIIVVIFVILTVVGYSSNLPEDYYTLQFFCRPDSWTFYFGVLLPFGLVYLFNWSLFLLIALHLCCRTLPDKEEEKRRTQLKDKVFLPLAEVAAILSVFFGVGWAFGLVVGTPNPALSIAAQYIFSVFVLGHAFLVLLLYGVSRRRVRKEWKRWVRDYLCCLFTAPSPVPKTDQLTASMLNPPPLLSSKTLTGVMAQQETSEVPVMNPLYQSEEDLLSAQKKEPVMEPLRHHSLRGNEGITGAVEQQNVQMDTQTLEFNFMASRDRLQDIDDESDDDDTNEFDMDPKVLFGMVDGAHFQPGRTSLTLMQEIENETRFSGSLVMSNVGALETTTVESVKVETTTTATSVFHSQTSSDINSREEESTEQGKELEPALPVLEEEEEEPGREKEKDTQSEESETVAVDFSPTPGEVSMGSETAALEFYASTSTSTSTTPTNY